MADLDLDAKQESNNFDSDFEKLDPYAAPVSQDDVVTSSAYNREEAEEDLYSASPASTAEAEAKLVSFDDEPTRPSKQSAAEPDSSSLTKHVEDVSSSRDSWFQNIDPQVIDLIYWRDIKKTAIVFSSFMLLLISLACCSVLSVLAYLSLAVLTVTISFRIYKNVLQAVQKSSDGHPFKQYLDVDINVSADKVHQAADIIVKHGVCTIKELRHLFLVEDLVDSVKFGLLLWVMTYIGAWFNGMTLVILAVVGIFSIPKVYETYKVQIDQYLDLARTNIRQVVKTIQDKIPLPGKKEKAQ